MPSAAMLTESQAHILRQRPEVVSVFENVIIGVLDSGISLLQNSWNSPLNVYYFLPFSCFSFEPCLHQMELML
ncbi:hypothetical protein R1flu_022710 [Riccia fluitans]|uniref:Inhibitor I9 domain-containing protein n=1 Tax=Riccia fluitans TaxID=41844 RepID=A0ABD1XPY8_9MARC